MTCKEQNKILVDKIESNINQYKVDRLNAEISAFSSGDLNKYEFLKKIDLNYKPNAFDKARFEFSQLGRTFNEGLDKTIPNYQEEGVIKLLKEIRDNLAGGINRPAGLIIPPGPPGPQGPQGPQEPPPPGPPQTPLSSLSSSSDSSSDLTSVTPKTPPPAPRTTINTQMPLQPIITTINTRILPTPSVSLPTIPTPSQIPVSISTPISTPSRIPSGIPMSTPIQSRIPIPILNPLDESKERTPFIIKKRITDPFDNIKISSKVSHDDNNGDIDDDSLYDYVPYNPGPGTRTAIIVVERDIKDSYDNINYLQKKLLDTKNYDEYNKILNNIDQSKKNIPKKEKELYYLKMGLIKKKKANKKEPTKKIRTDEARPLYSPERRKADLDIEEMLLKIDNDKVSNLSKKIFKKGKEDKSEKENIKKVDVDKIMELFYPPEQRIANFEEEDKNENGNIKKVDVDKIMELFYPPEQRIANFEEEDEKWKRKYKKS